jgi:serine/threonine protein kinase
MEVGALHRDLKPANILIHYPSSHEKQVSPDNPKDIVTKGALIKLADFGLAYPAKEDEDFCVSVVGTKYYWSPELWEEKEYDAKSEIWALGAIMYELS